MNRDIQILREVITKLVPLLTGKGLKVTQRGTQAYVQANPKTNKPELVNIPSIPDNASDDFISAVAGFVDHEVAHVLFTDWAFYGGDGVAVNKFSVEGQALSNAHNIIEDTMIEREIIKTFPGAEHNLDKLHRHFLEKITTPAVQSAKGNQEQEFAYLIVPMMRALSGQEQFQEFMDKNGHWKHPMIENLHMAMSDEALELIKKARTTKETLEVAQEVHDILFNNKKRKEEEQPQPPQQKQKPQKQKGKSQDKPEKEAGEGDGDGARDHSKNEGEAGDQSAAGEDGGDQAGGDDAASGGAQKDGEKEDAGEDESGEGGADGEEKDEAGDESDGEEDGAGSSADESEDDEQGDGASGGEEADEAEDDAEDGAGSGVGDDEDGDESDEKADGSGEDGDESDDGQADGESAEFAEEDEEYENNKGHEASSDEESAGDGGGVGGDAGKSMFNLDPSTFKPIDLSTAIANEIQEMASKAVGEADYSVFTKDEDEIKILEVPDGVMKDEWVPLLDDAVSAMIGPMQKDIERLMAAQSLSVRTSGHRSGRLHSASLYRVMQGDPRVFQRKEEHNSKDTAVMLLVDNSGSMSGDRCVVAMKSAYALAQTLERVGIPSEIIGFTTGNMSRAAQQQASDEYTKHGVHFSRSHHTIVMPIYKTFNERLNATVKKRIAFQLNVQAGMNTNTDGESLEYAAMRLIPRREKRKVMLVLSDGQPVGTGSGQHLKATVQNLTRIGIETVGIGIQSDAVKHFYPRYMTLQNVTDLPAAVMGELKRILTN